MLPLTTTIISVTIPYMLSRYTKLGKDRKVPKSTYVHAWEEVASDIAAIDKKEQE